MEVFQGKQLEMDGKNLLWQRESRRECHLEMLTEKPSSNICIQWGQGEEGEYGYIIQYCALFSFFINTQFSPYGFGCCLSFCQSVSSLLWFSSVSQMNSGIFAYQVGTYPDDLDTPKFSKISICAYLIHFQILVSNFVISLFLYSCVVEARIKRGKDIF